ncbi:MAG: FHA domain-containing protein [Anaerolineales bacterium]
MSRRMRTYYYAVVGALGGLLAWQASNLLGLSFSSNIYLSNAGAGALIGLCVGLPLGAAEGLAALSPLRALRGGLFGGLVGLVGGAIGLPLGELIFQAVGAGLLGRALGWAIFGALIGVAEGVTGGSQMWKGALGGALGGMLGGALLELLPTVGDDLAMGKAAGLILLGTSVGALIALITVLLTKAWLEVVEGKMRGSTFILDKFMTSKGPSAFIGSSPLKAEIAIADPDVEPQHAMLIGGDTHFTLKDMSRAGTYINGRKIEQARLANGAKVRLGQSQLVYHERR